MEAKSAAFLRFFEHPFLGNPLRNRLEASTAGTRRPELYRGLGLSFQGNARSLSGTVFTTTEEALPRISQSPWRLANQGTEMHVAWVVPVSVNIATTFPFAS